MVREKAVRDKSTWVAARDGLVPRLLVVGVAGAAGPNAGLPFRPTGGHSKGAHPKGRAAIGRDERGGVLARKFEKVPISARGVEWKGQEEIQGSTFFKKKRENMRGAYFGWVVSMTWVRVCVACWGPSNPFISRSTRVASGSGAVSGPPPSLVLAAAEFVAAFPSVGTPTVPKQNVCQPMAIVSAFKTCIHSANPIRWAPISKAS